MQLNQILTACSCLCAPFRLDKEMKKLAIGHLAISITLLCVIAAAQAQSASARRRRTTAASANRGKVASTAALGWTRSAKVQQSPSDIYTDPCKAPAFLGDIALSEEDMQLFFPRTNERIRQKGSIGVAINSSTNSRDQTKKTCNRITLEAAQNAAAGSNAGSKNNRTRKTLRSKSRKTTALTGSGEDCVTKQPATKSKSRSKRAATNRTERLWEYGVIPYVIESNFSGQHKALFKQAMRHWENYTCITFVEKAPYHENYILFTERNCGCCSFVGKRGNGAQAISIGKNCDKFGIVIHELGHVVGFWHEHTRPDRDAHVNVYYHNVMIGQEYNFNKLPAEEVNSLNEEYDYESIMHYSRNTFAKQNNLDTILPRQKQHMSVMPEIGQRVRLSPGDIRQTNKLYGCPSCGDTLMESSGSFSSLSLMMRSSDGRVQPLLCQWRISGTHGERVMLNITSWNFGNSRQSCETDYLEVRDGNYVGSPLIGRYCGKSSPGTLLSTESRMWIEYRRTVPTNNNFAAAYEILCGGEITKESGQLSSPNYPDMYKPNKECVWKIKVPEGCSIALSFQTFEIEQHAGCSYDYLEIRDGEDENAPLVDRLCGYRLPDDIQSRSNALYIKFVSDYSVTKHGFLATFVKEVDECANGQHECEQGCKNTPGGYECECRTGYDLAANGRQCTVACGGYLRSANGTIVSPEYPSLYPLNKNCVWIIIAPLQHKIMLNFTHFDVEGNDNECEYDYVEVQHVTPRNASAGKRLGLFCGQILPKALTSTSNMLRVEFKSDNSVQRFGFQASFTIDRDECEDSNGGCSHQCVNTLGSYYCACNSGFELHDNGRDCKEGSCQHVITVNQAEVTSPKWPEQYPASKLCTWLFNTTNGHRAKLSFTSFQLESHAHCVYDKVVLYDGASKTDREIGAFCKDMPSETPSFFISSGSSLFMMFISDSSVQRQGFRAIYSTVCGANLTAFSDPQYFYSHPSFGGQDYMPQQNCEWLIQAPADQCVHLRFTMFELENDNDCDYDYVEVYSGRNTSDRLGKFCGTRVRDLTSSSPLMYIRFVSDDTISGKGFVAAYITTDCNAPPNHGVTNTPSVFIPNRKVDAGRVIKVSEQETTIASKGKSTTADPNSIIHGPVFYGGQQFQSSVSAVSSSAWNANPRRRTRRPAVEEGFIE